MLRDLNAEVLLLSDVGPSKFKGLILPLAPLVSVLQLLLGLGKYFILIVAAKKKIIHMDTCNAT